MRLAVFGATGGTGRLLVEQALAAGHEVTAVVRRPSAVGARHGRLEVVRGDVLDPAPMLTDGPRTGRYGVAANDYLRKPGRISRADLADHMLAHLDDPASYRAKVGIPY